MHSLDIFMSKFNLTSRDVTDYISFQAYQQGITGEGYLWMLIGWYNDKWWEKDDPEVKCTSTELREAIRGYISLESLTLGDPSVVTVANIVSIVLVNVPCRAVCREIGRLLWGIGSSEFVTMC